MDLKWYLGAYWKSREESTDQCADRLELFFANLASIDNRLAHWYETAQSRAAALRKRADVANRDYLVDLLRRHKYREPDLGFHLGLWNGGETDEAIGASISCGNHSPWVWNSVVIDLPHCLGSLSDASHMCELLSTVVRAWEPEWAGVQSQEATVSRERQAERPFLDWMLYLRRDWLTAGVTLHEPARVVSLENLGAIIITQDAPPNPTDAMHVARIERASKALNL